MANWRQVRPKDIPNLVAWFDAAKGITLNGSDVSAWADQSGNGNDLAQGTASAQPAYNSTDSNFNSQPSITFDGVDEYMTTSAFSAEISQPITKAIVYKNASTGAGYHWHTDGIVNGKRIGFFSNGTDLRLYAGSSEQNYHTANTSAHVAIALFDGASSNIWRDGTASTPANPGTNPMTGLTLGASYDLGAFFDGEVAELLIYDRDLTTTEKNAIGRYLAGKYGTTRTAITGSNWKLRDRRN